MAIITNEDLKIMVEVEDLLYNKLVKTNGIKENFDGKESYYFNEDDSEYNTWIHYWNMVERFIQDKKKANKKSAKFNKDHAEYHRLSNNLYSARKRKDSEKVEYYTKKLEEYKKLR